MNINKHTVLGVFKVSWAQKNSRFLLDLLASIKYFMLETYPHKITTNKSQRNVFNGSVFFTNGRKLTSSYMVNCFFIIIIQYRG